MPRAWYSTLKELREEKGLTQQEVAEEVGVTPTFISYIETGHKTPSVYVLRHYASALGYKSLAALCKKIGL